MPVIRNIIDLFFDIIALPFILVTYISVWRLSQRLKQKLGEKNRVLSRDEAKQRIARNEGILLLDDPAFGWPIVRIWWSSRTDYLPRSERLDGEEACKEDIENYYRFIDTEKGSACLVEGAVIFKPYINKHYGIRNCLYVATGSVWYDEDEKKTSS